jgi:ABC-type polysaccharide/polyol phosphate export permease
MPGRLITVWKFRHFWLSLAGMDLRVRYRRSILGIGWSLLNPIVMTIVFCIAFASWQGNGDWRTAAPFYIAGLAVWDFIKHSAVQGSLTFIRNEPYIRQSPLPLAVYTLRTSLGTMVHFGIALGLGVVSASILHPTDHLTPFYALPSVFAATLLIVAFAWAVTALCAIANVFFRDTQHLAEVSLGICFFLTPIIYPKDRLIERGLGFLADINPVVIFLDIIRDPLLSGEAPSAGAFAKAMGLTFIALVAAVASLARFERRLIFHL